MSIATAAFTQTSLVVNGEAVTLAVDGFNQAMAQVTGTWSGGLAFEGTVDGANWFAISGTPVPSGSATSSTTANGQWTFNVYGLGKMRLRASVLNSGSVEIAIRATV